MALADVPVVSPPFSAGSWTTAKRKANQSRFPSISNPPLRAVNFGNSVVLHYDRYSTFVRVGAGFSYTDYLWMRDKPWKEYDPNNPPAFLQVAKTKSLEDKPELYLDPEECVWCLIYHNPLLAYGSRNVSKCMTYSFRFLSVRSSSRSRQQRSSLQVRSILSTQEIMT